MREDAAGFSVAQAPDVSLATKVYYSAMAMDLRALRLFQAVAERRNFSRAAMDLGLTQPAISAQIAKLEGEVGAKLIVRSRPNVQLTALGETLKWHAEQVFAVIDKADHEMREKRGPQRGVLRVGHTQSHRDAALAAAASIMENMPDLRIVLEELVAPQLEDRLLDHHLDVGLRGYVKTEPEGDSGLNYAELGQTRFPLIVGARHRFAKAKEVPLERLDSERFALIGRGGQHRKTLDSYFRREKFRPEVMAEASTVGGVLDLLRARAELVTIIAMPTQHLADLRARGLVAVQVPGAPMQTSVMLWPGRQLQGEVALAFLEALRERFRAPAR